MATGFEFAPSTLLVSVTSFLFTFSLGGSSSVLFDLDRILRGEVLRIISSAFVFKHMGECVLGTILMYSLRHCERMLGSRKFGTFMSIALILSVLIQLAIVTSLYSLDIRFIPSSGPYFFIFAAMPLYYYYVPKISGTSYSVLGQRKLSLDLSEKSWVYLLAAQLSLCQGSRSLVPAAVGTAVGLLYLSESLGLQSFRFPKAVEDSVALFGSFVVGIIPVTLSPRRQNARARQDAFPGDRRADMGAAFNQAAQNFGRDLDRGLQGYGGLGPALAAPAESDIATLTAMGFDRAAVMQALMLSDNNVDAAANMLLR